MIRSADELDGGIGLRDALRMRLQRDVSALKIAPKAETKDRLLCESTICPNADSGAPVGNIHAQPMEYVLVKES